MLNPPPKTREVRFSVPFAVAAFVVLTLLGLLHLLRLTSYLHHLHL